MNATLRTLVLTVAALAANTAAQADQALAQKKACLTCHTVDKKVVGPSFKEVAAKYAKDKKAADMLAEKIIKGGSGNWGNAPMPPNNVTPEESKKLVAWILGLK